MCCIFTCVGWLIDLIQRLWTFTMACCIASAVCCAILTACMSGVALGYNYSLAEYIDLKETNVSVYLKRGVFDDDIVDDMDWRRSGHQPISGHIRDDNLVSASPQDSEVSPWRSGRRMDDSIFESDDRHKFEGSLMKLTAKPVDYKPTATEPYVADDKISEAQSSYPRGSLDQLKAIQSVINSRKFNSARYTTNKGDTPMSTLDYDDRLLAQVPDDTMLPSVRRMIGPNPNQPPPGPGDSARSAVPDESIGNAWKWFNPKLPPGKRVTLYENELDNPATYPPPVTPRPGPLMPSRPPPPRTSPNSPTKYPQHTAKDKNINDVLEDDMDAFKQKLLLDEPFRSHEFLNRMRGSSNKKSDSEDYGEDIKGLPIRRKRLVLDEREEESTGLNNYVIQTTSNNTLASASEDTKPIILKLNETKGNNYSARYNSSVSNSSKATNVFTFVGKRTIIDQLNFSIYKHTLNNLDFVVNTRQAKQNTTQEGNSGLKSLLSKFDMTIVPIK